MPMSTSLVPSKNPVVLASAIGPGDTRTWFCGGFSSEGVAPDEGVLPRVVVREGVVLSVAFGSSSPPVQPADGRSGATTRGVARRRRWVTGASLRRGSVEAIAR